MVNAWFTPLVNTIWCMFVVLLLFLLRPLWLLAKESHALIIMLSRLICNIIATGLFNVIPNAYRIYFSPKLIYPHWYAYIDYWLDNANYLHALTMALNRGHSVLFPIHYMFFTSKKQIVIQCICTYAVSVGFTCLQLLVLGNNIFLILGIYTFCAIIYAAIVVRMFIYKYSTKSWVNRQAAAEKNTVKITLCCFSNIFFNLCHFALNTDRVYNFLENSLIPTSFVLYCVYYALEACIPTISEELCLMALCKEFRQNILAQCATFWNWLCCHPEPTRNGVGNQRIMVVNPRRIGEAVRVNNFVGR